MIRVFCLEFNMYYTIDLWVETKNILLKMINTTLSADGNGNGITETPFLSEKNEWTVIGGRKKWRRNCPICNKLLLYTENWVKNRANRLNTKCKSCSTKGKFVSQETRKKQSVSFKGRKVSKKTRVAMSVAHTGKKHSDETKLKMSGENNGMFGVYRTGEQNPFFGKNHNDASKLKMRLSAAKRVIQKNASTGRLNNINPREFDYFKKIENEKNWDGIFYGKNTHQFYVEKLGYFVDYYEPQLNIVVEYDEPRHYVANELRNKDLTRMVRIKKLLNCRFYRYNEKLNILVEW